MATILIVDDHPTNREFLITLLGYAGYRLLEASGGAEALEVTRVERPDLAIVDILMPGMDGYEFVRQLRTDPMIAQTRVIFYTATYLQAEAWSLARACDVHQIITKPAEPERVLKIVAEALQSERGSVPQPLSPEEFYCEHLQVVTDKLAKQIEVLEQEAAERKRIEDALQQEVQVTTALARMGRALIASLDTPVILDRLYRLTTEILACDCTHLVLWQPKQNAYGFMASSNDLPEHRDLLRIATVPRETMATILTQLQQREVMQVTTATQHEPFSALLAQLAGVTSALWVTLYQGAEPSGILSIGDKEHIRSFTPQQERIALGIAHIASFALTNAKLFEAAEYANRLKSDFLAAMSHELRTPLHIVLGYTDLLLDDDFGPLTTEQKESLQRVKRAAVGEVELITTLLDVSRLEAGRLLVEVQEVNVGELLQDLQQETTLLHEKPGVRLIWQIAAELPSLYTDRAKLKIVLKNLLSNALKFTEQGNITIAVQPQHGGVEFSVADTGVGITPEVLPRIFEMFQRGEDATTQHYEGSGLGLYIIRRILDLLEGTVMVESTVGRGSTFRVWMPKKKVPRITHDTQRVVSDR